MTHTLHLGDCRTVLSTLDDASIDSIVCDPPYELGFMGKAWDNSGIAYDVTVWQQCLRVLKPGGHLIAFGGSRTYHRLAVAIEDAGFEIRDQIQWIYANGFPKSLDVSKAMDKQRDDRDQTLEVTAWIRQARDNAGLSNATIDDAFGMNGMAGHWTSQASQPSVPTLDQIPVLLDLFGLTLDDVPDDVRTLIWTLNGNKGKPGKAWGERTFVTEKREDMFGEYEVDDVRTMQDTKKARIGIPLQISAKHQVTITAPATDIAKQWQGWGTALKPAHEPAVLARKPLCGTVADNVIAWGVGALNIDGTRIAAFDGYEKAWDAPVRTNISKGSASFGTGKSSVGGTHAVDISANKPTAGRWPANVIFDEEAAQVLDEQSGERNYHGGIFKTRDFKGWNKVGELREKLVLNHPGSGGASRFFYVAKASKAEREAGLYYEEWVKAGAMSGAEYREDRPTNHPLRANHHPTVKPLALMRYLVRLVTPKGGKVLDPFMGSGSTGCAAVREGFDFVGIDITPEYVAIAQKRIAHYAVESPLEGML